MSFWLKTSHDCGLITIDDNFFIIETCSIYAWMQGKSIDIVLHYLASEKQFIDLKVIGK